MGNKKLFASYHHSSLVTRFMNIVKRPNKPQIVEFVFVSPISPQVQESPTLPRL